VSKVTAHRRVLMMVSKAYYFEGKSKVRIGDELGISRFKVARYLGEARENGMVSITLSSGNPLPELSEALREHLKLERVQVIEVYGSEQDVRRMVGRAAGTYLREVLVEGEVLGIGWGRTLNAMLDGLDYLPQVEVLGLAGRFVADLSNSAAELMRQAVALTGGEGRIIPVPFFVGDARMANALRRQPKIAQRIADFDRLTTAVVAIGTIAEKAGGVAFSSMPERFAESVLAAGAVGEICGNLFAEDGHSIDLRLRRYTFAITANQLRRVRRVVAAASGISKADAVRAICCSGVLTDLIADVELAGALFRLPPVIEKLGRSA
jgi:DNA-binding transcriptional regulator LsrR (DeoR family)